MAGFVRTKKNKVVMELSPELVELAQNGLKPLCFEL